jgi:flagellar hook-associated protein 3 FlgL
MRITYNSFYNGLTDRLGSLNSMQQKALQELSTGQKLTLASDDPTAMQRVLELRTSKAQETQFWKNAGDVASTSKASTNDLKQLHGVLTRVGELTTSGSSELNNAPNFDAYASETDQLLEQALTQANSRLSGKYHHGGTATDTPPFVAVRDAVTNKITSVNYVGNITEAQVRISESSTVSPYTNGTENTNMRDLLNNMVALRDGLQAGSASTVKALRPAQETIEDQLLSSISRAGAIQYRLEVSQAQATQRFASDETLISRDADSDFADATVRFNRSQTAYSAAVQSSARIASTSLLDYIR